MIRQWHLRNGWSDKGYHLVILPDGRCEEGRPLYRQGAHCVAGHRNFIGIGICLVGNFSESKEVPAAQFNGLLDKIKSFEGRVQIDSRGCRAPSRSSGSSDGVECPGHYFPVERLRKELEGR